MRSVIMAQHSEPAGPDPDDLARFGLLLGGLPLVFSPIYMLWRPYDAMTGNVLTATTPGQLIIVIVDTIVYSYSVALFPTLTDRPSTFLESFPALMASTTMLGLLVILIIAIFQVHRSDDL